MPLFEIFPEDNCTFPKYLQEPVTSAVLVPGKKYPETGGNHVLGYRECGTGEGVCVHPGT